MPCYQPVPTWTKPCGECGEEMDRYRGETYVYCPECGAEHNAGGQLLRRDWRDDCHEYGERYDEDY